VAAAGRPPVLVHSGLASAVPGRRVNTSLLYHLYLRNISMAIEILDWLRFTLVAEIYTCG
jgi:hypothetical protein